MMHPINPCDHEKLRYPVGHFVAPSNYTAETIKKWIAEIDAFPNNVAQHTEGLSDIALNWRYRPNGWTIQQVVHHCADSHMNSFIRFKLALTEEAPTIRPYFENLWAEQPDYTSLSIQHSITLLTGLHARWTCLLNSLTNNDLSRTFIHPEHGTRTSLGENIGIYDWHCRHHLAHIKQAKKLNQPSTSEH